MVKIRIKSFPMLTTLVPVVGLAYFAIFFLTEDVQSIASGSDLEFFQWLFLPLVIASLLTILAILFRPRLGFVFASVVSAILIVMYSAAPKPNGMIDVLSNPLNTTEFVFHWTNYPTLIGVLVYSVIAFRGPNKADPCLNPNSPKSTIARSTLIAVLILGVIVGGLVVGGLAGATQASLLASTGTTADIAIVQGAGSPQNGQFYSPVNFTTRVGSTVMWINRDSTAHTVTSTSGVFDSGNMDSGATFRFTFMQIGTYKYYCKYHQWMKGTVVVT
jgi:plastocyanin